MCRPEQRSGRSVVIAPPCTKALAQASGVASTIRLQTNRSSPPFKGIIVPLPPSRYQPAALLVLASLCPGFVPHHYIPSTPPAFPPCHRPNSLSFVKTTVFLLSVARARLIRRQGERWEKQERERKTRRVCEARHGTARYGAAGQDQGKAVMQINHERRKTSLV